MQPRPNSITWLAAIVVLVICINIVNILMHIDELSSALAIGILVGQAIYATMVCFALNRKKWAIYVIAALYVVDIANFLFLLSSGVEYSWEQVLLGLATLILVGTAIYGAFSAASVAWFAGEAYQPTEEETRYWHRHWRFGGGALVAGVAGLAVYVFGWMWFVDWEAVSQECLEGGDGVDRVAACTLIIDGGVIAGRDLADVYIARGDLGGPVEGPGFASHRIREDYYQATLADDSYLTAWLRYGNQMYHRDGRPVRGAINAFARAVELAPDDASVRALLGQTLRIDGRLEEALPHLLAGWEAHPEDLVNSVELATAHLDLGNLEDAVALADQLLARGDLGEALTVPVLRVRALSLIHLGRFEDATEVMRVVMTEQPWRDVDDHWGLEEAALVAVLAPCLAGESDAARDRMDSHMSPAGVTAMQWRRYLIAWGYIERRDVPEPRTLNDLNEPLDAVLDAWIADRCPQTAFATADPG